MRADSLENHIKARPKPAELIEKGILNGELLPRHACALWNECTDFVVQRTRTRCKTASPKAVDGSYMGDGKGGV